MQQIRLPLFYDLQAVIRQSDFHRKYDLIFQSLDLSEVRDTNGGVGRTGFSRHAMFRAFIVKHLEGIKSVPRLIALGNFAIAQNDGERVGFFVVYDFHGCLQYLATLLVLYEVTT